MALAAIKTFVTGEVLYAADLNALNTNILNNALSLISPLTGNLNVSNNQLTAFRLENLSAHPAAAQAGRAWWQTGDAVLGLDTGSRVLAVLPEQRNLLLNGDFRVWQRGTPITSTTTPANSDATYVADRWILLSNGNNVVSVAQEVSVIESGSNAACAMTVVTANLKWGLLQVLEERDTAAYLSLGANQRCSLSFKARVSAGTTITNLRAAVLTWDGMFDNVTRDVVSVWGIAGTDPTLVANWTYENTPSNLALTTSYQTFRIENVAIDTASGSNVAVFIWVDDTDATATNILYLTDVQLEHGRTASAFERRSLALETILCQRFAYSLTPGLSKLLAYGNSQSTTGATAGHSFPQRMRVAPALTLESAVCFMVQDGAGTNIGTSAVAATGVTVDFAGYAITVNAGLTAGRAVPFLTSSMTNKNLIWDAEL